MSEMRFSASALGEAVAALCAEHVELVQEKADAAVEKAAKVTRSQIKATAPRRTGGYAAGWRIAVEEAYGAKTATVYNAPVPSLPHLLEKGHGGPAPSAPIVHIEPAYEAGRAALLDALE